MNQNIIKIQKLLMYLECFNVIYTSFSTSITTKVQSNHVFNAVLDNTVIIDSNCNLTQLEFLEAYHIEKF